ncbi:MAG: hypothetical protein RDV48_22450 [Candidatus Eremiobacteraeota bacterium]|nr:hypothetical protein [Candidatus Eremiobacteraeota bacterium]
MTYAINYATSADINLLAIADDSLRQRIILQIDRLTDFPNVPNVKKLKAGRECPSPVN